ncbi:MAG: PQQ-binding-like beta-propeller repeat protein [Acidobacteria bacterium]|nr:PQQ-binding-like beta-propeller repeat protein [Acidobacteriota bacterium]
MSFRFLISFAILFLQVHCVFAQIGEQKPAAIVKCATLQLPSTPVTGVLASDGDRIYAGTVNGTFSGFESRNLRILWRVELGGEFVSGIALTEAGAVTVTNSVGDGNAVDGSTIRLFSKESGIPIWSTKLPYSERYFLGRINGSIAAVNSRGEIMLIDRAKGQIQWQAGPFGKLSSRPSFSSTSVVLATGDKNLTVVSAKTGGILSRQATEFVPTAVAFLKNEGIAAGDERGNVTLFGSQVARSIWRFKSGAGVSSVSEVNGGILVTSLDNFVYLLSDYNGDVIWKRRLTGRVVEGGLTIDDHFVVLMNGENSAYVIDLLKGKVTDTIPASDIDLINRLPVFVRNRTFVLSTLFSLDLYSLGDCTE